MQRWRGTSPPRGLPVPLSPCLSVFSPPRLLASLVRNPILVQKGSGMSRSLRMIYTLLEAHFGLNPAWWPIFGDDAPFEMLLGAILVQQTRWEAVEGAILRLRDAGLLAPEALAQADAAAVAALLRPVAFHTQKAPGIIAISAHLCAHYAGDTAALLAQPTAELRRELLALPRIGPETADVILLYAGGHAVFVVDDYTRRLLGRIDPQLESTVNGKFDWERRRYEAVRECIESELNHHADERSQNPKPALERSEGSKIQNLKSFYADFHALINEQCVRYCLARNPRCDGPPARRVYSVQEGRESYLDRHDGCPLREICAFYQARAR